VTLVVLTIVAAAGSRTEPLRRLVVSTLADRLDSDVELKAFSVDTFPTVVVYGEGLLLRLRAQDSTLPPLIQIQSFTVHCNLFDLLRRPRRFRTVTLEGLVVNIPPGGLKTTARRAQEAIVGAPAQAARPAQEPVEKASRPDDGGASDPPIVVDELRADGALLRIIPRRADKDPKEFAIQALTMHTLGLGQQMPFKATLTNPIPRGQIESTGTFGPWKKSNPGSTPLGGNYSFQNADLGTIKGIGGILNSTGTFGGELQRIAVKGQTHTPDFHIDVSGNPVALSTSFDAVVDGTDGDTYLDTVNAQFRKTVLTAKGAVVGTKGVRGRTVQLNVHIQEGRIEDLLWLAVKGDKTLMVGGVGLRTDFLLPPGEPDVIERLQLEGEFDVDAAKFTDAGVQGKLAGMSHRARGRDPDEKAANVVSDLGGKFRLRNATLALTDIAFTMPGAVVRLHGSYGLRSEMLNFDGTVRMEATISQAVGAGGVKGFLLKMVDPIFRKKGAGAVIPIRIRGTREQPKFGVDVGRVFKQR
jgi:AsmA-like C-terminal region